MLKGLKSGFKVRPVWTTNYRAIEFIVKEDLHNNYRIGFLLVLCCVQWYEFTKVIQAIRTIEEVSRFYIREASNIDVSSSLTNSIKVRIDFHKVANTDVPPTNCFVVQYRTSSIITSRLLIWSQFHWSIEKYSKLPMGCVCIAPEYSERSGPLYSTTPSNGISRIR